MSQINEERLTAFLVEEQARFYRLAYSYLKNREEALDACTDQLRKRKLMTFVPPEALDAGSYEEPLPEDGSLARRVDALPVEVGTIVKLRFYEELSLKEISAVTGCPLSTVKTRLYTGLKKLRVSMEGDEIE